MNFEGTRFTVGPFCPADICNSPVVWGNTGRTRELFDAVPHKDGAWLLKDTLDATPFAQKLTNAKQFGRQGQLHRRHTDHCVAYKRIKKR